MSVMCSPGLVYGHTHSGVCVSALSMEAEVDVGYFLHTWVGSPTELGASLGWLCMEPRGPSVSASPTLGLQEGVPGFYMWVLGI